jgi:hypothetical protein
VRRSDWPVLSTWSGVLDTAAWRRAKLAGVSSSRRCFGAHMFEEAHSLRSKIVPLQTRHVVEISTSL